MRFKNEIVLVTGGSRGIGKASALLFAKEGATVIINYVKNKEEADKTLKELKKFEPKSIAVQADVSKENDVNKLFDEIKKQFGRLDILFANAGVVSPKDPFELSSEDFKRTLDINLLGIFLCVREAGKMMKKQKSGKIVCTSSIRGLEHCGRETVLDYCVSKSGVISLVKVFARKLGPEITINAVAPGFTETDMAKSWPPELRKKWTEESCLKRFATSEDIAKAVAFLSSNDSDFITGHVLVVDGGYNLK